MLDSSTFTQDMLSNPSKLAKTVIDMMEATDTSGNLTINDPNNGFVMQLFANLAIYSKFSEKIDYINNFFYSQRARNSEQLFPHLSEFDYLTLTASPATLPFVLAMSKDWIVANAVYYDANYNKLQIPATSYVTMGGAVYSMYYPIDILVNRNTGAVTSFYNTDTTNSLYSLESNILLDIQEYTQNGINYFHISFNMFQFNRTVSSYTVSSEQGFVKTLSYDDQFYAIKVFNQKTDGTWSELAYSLSELNYDYTVPTALINILADQAKVKIEIPQIYFDNNQIAQKIKIELYTTKGSVSYSLSLADVTGLKANFDTTSSSYAAPLAQIPGVVMVPTTTEVAGGSDAMDFDAIRDVVVNQRARDGVAVTMQELTEVFRKAGFTPTRLVDDLTERVYYASNILTDDAGMAIPTFVGSILIADDALTGNPSTILNFTDGYYTILPTTTFKGANTSLTCVPMSDGDVAAMQAMTKYEQADALNTRDYVRQPFHITLLTTPKSPEAAVFNLLSPEMTSLVFVRENAHSAPQMSVIACSVVHKDNGTGGFQIRMTVGRSSSITSASATNFQVLLTCVTKIGSKAYFPATYIGADSNGNDVWEAILTTNYHITTDEYLTVMMYNDSDVLSSVEIPLTQKFTVVTAFTSSFAPTVPTDALLTNTLPLSYTYSHTAMASQIMTVVFGTNLSQQIYCGVNTTWGNDVYETADTTTYYTTNVPVFQTNEVGVIETKWNGSTSKAEVVVLYQPGSTPASTEDIIVTSTAIAPVNETHGVIAVDDVTGLLVGMSIRGTDVPVDATITAISGLNITLSQPITAAIASGTAITVTNPHPLLRVSVVQAEAGPVVKVADTSSLIVGQSVFGFGVADGSKILTVDSATQFTLDKDTTEALAVNTLLTVLNTTAHGVVKVAQGEIVTDPTGAPVVIKDAQNQYRIPAILFDGRLFASEDPNDLEIVNTISEKIQNYANQISTLDAGLTESSDVYYKPARTMGDATFGIGDSKTIRIPLELSFEFTVYVEKAVYNTTPILETMKASIYEIVNTQIQSPVISVSVMATTVKDKLGTNVIAVEMKPISGIDDLSLIALEETDCMASIDSKLSVQSDGSITRAPNIVINFIPRPDTLDTIATNTL